MGGAVGGTDGGEVGAVVGAVTAGLRLGGTVGLDVGRTVGPWFTKCQNTFVFCRKMVRTVGELFLTSKENV